MKTTTAGVDRALSTVLALGRAGYGAALIVAPGSVARGWLGDDAARPPVEVAVRAVGARDLALAAGTIAHRDKPRRRAWLLAAAASDLADLAATLAAGDALSRRARIGTIVLAGGSALAGIALAGADGRRP
jgi:hypothetical protein